jgi:hypothetical protein
VLAQQGPLRGCERTQIDGMRFKFEWVGHDGLREVVAKALQGPIVLIK